MTVVPTDCCYLFIFPSLFFLRSHFLSFLYLPCEPAPPSTISPPHYHPESGNKTGRKKGRHTTTHIFHPVSFYLHVFFFLLFFLLYKRSCQVNKSPPLSFFHTQTMKQTRFMQAEMIFHKQGKTMAYLVSMLLQIVYINSSRLKN